MIATSHSSTTMLGVLRAKLIGLGRDEDGAALVITLAIFFLMYLGCMGVYAISMAVKERIQLQNAADAAAYSAAVVQADTLSRIATINRAMSWTYVQMTREQMDYIVLRWLKHTVKHYKQDRDGAKKYNREGVLGRPCSRHRRCGTGWFIGATSYGGKYKARLNGLFLTSIMEKLGVDLGPLQNISGLVGVGSTPIVLKRDGGMSSLESALSSYEEYYLLKDAVSGFSTIAAGVSILTSLKDDAVKVNPADFPSGDGRDSVVETIRSVDEMWRKSGFANNESTLSTKYEGNGSDCEKLFQLRILIDRVNIALMNIYERRLVCEMPNRIARAVDDIVEANIPEYMAEDCLYYLSQKDDPLEGEIMGVGDGYFGNLYNNDTCERRFVAWSGYDGNLIETFMGMQNAVGRFLTSRVAAGLDQWFVRGNGNSRTDNARGLQRCYKHWAEGPFSNIHMSHNPLPPSCWNTDVNVLHESPPSIALHSEWAWWSDVWSCPRIFGKRIHIHPMIHKDDYWPWKMECSHNTQPGLLGADDLKAFKKTLGDIPESMDDVENLVKGLLKGRTDSEGNQISVTADAYGSGENAEALANAINKVEDDLSGKVDFENRDPGGDVNELGSSGGNVNDFEDGCLITYPVLNLTSHFVGFGRLYADAPQIYNSCYVGEKAKPLILRKAYFGKAGTISVGIRRKNENVFLRILKKIEGIFTAFDPDWNDGDDTHTYVFASAKAGYKDKGEDADSRQYKIDWQPNNQNWNLCQSDWDAVFVPVRKAHSYAISGGWLDGDGDMLFDWVISMADEWKPVAGNGGEDYMSRNVYAPRGVLRGNGHDGKLKWRELSHVMFH